MQNKILKGISVIIPVYNAEKYLARCLDSVLNQTFTNVQVVVVDDGSTDSSPGIIRAYASRDNVTAVFNETNRGAAYCRNKALNLILTEYVGFVDADDYIDSRYYELLFSEMVKTGADIAVCDFHIIAEDHELFIDASQGENSRYSFVNHSMAASPCNKLFKKELLIKYPFAEGIMNEDIPAVIPALVHAKNVCYLPKCYYTYFQHSESSQNSAFSMKRFDIFKAVDIAIERIGAGKEYEDYKRAVIFNQLVLLLVGVIPKEKRFFKRSKNIRNYNRLIAKYKVNPAIIENEFLQDQAFKMKKYYHILIKLSNLNMVFLANCLIQMYIVYKKHKNKKLFSVIRHDIDESVVINSAKKHSQLDDFCFCISVIIPNYNYSRFMFQRLYSILEQKVKIKEIIILDDCSSDDSAEKIKWIQDNIGKYINVKSVFNDANSGSAFKQWRKGLEMASGDYIWIAEADDYSEPGMLEKLAEPVRHDRSVTLSYCNTAFMDGGGYLMPVNVLKMIDLMHTGHWKKSYVNDGVDEIKHYAFLNCTISNVSSVLFKANVVTDFDDILKYKQAGDWLFYVKLMENGKVAYTNQILNYYRLHGSNVSSTTKKRDVLTEMIRIHQYILGHFGLNKSQKRHIMNRYRTLIKIWGLKEYKLDKRF